MDEQRPDIKVRGNQPVNHRMTVVASFHHQVNGGQPDSIAMTYDRELQVDEQFYRRNLKANLEAKKLSLGWIAEDNIPIGLIVIQNTDKRKDRYLEVVFVGSEASLKIRSGEHLSFEPINVEKICIRASAENTEYRISIIPG